MGGRERRRTVRLDARIKASVAILAPDQTFTPYKHHGEILDLSEGGLRICLQAFPRESYQSLIRGRNYAKVRGTLPGKARETVFHGEVKWIDYREAANPPECLIGIFFGYMDDATRNDLSAALAGLSLTDSEREAGGEDDEE